MGTDRTKKVKLIDYAVIMVIPSGLFLMVFMGKTPAGYIGCAIFILGSLLRIMEVMKKPIPKKRMIPEFLHQ